MSEKSLVVLGSSAQVPTRDRNQSGYYFYWDHQGFLFDPGEGTQRQMTRYGVKVTPLTKIFITHFHGDHCLGLPGIIQRMCLDGVQHEVQIYFPVSGREFYERLVLASFYSGTLNLKPCPVEKDGILLDDDHLTIEARKLDHPIDAYGYRIKNKDSVTLLPEHLKKLGVVGADIKRLKQEGKLLLNGRYIKLEEVSLPRIGESIAFVMDTRMCDAAIELARGVDLLVCEATYLEEQSQLAETYGHLTARQAASIAESAQAKKLVLGHFSQRYADTSAFLEEAQPIHENCFTARDGDRFPLPTKKRCL